MGLFKRFFGGKETEAVSEKPVKKENKKIKLDTDVDGFKSIDMFNTDAYIQDTFELLFHAIKVDAWPCNFTYSEMEFKRFGESENRVLCLWQLQNKKNNSNQWIQQLLL